MKTETNGVDSVRWSEEIHGPLDWFESDSDVELTDLTTGLQIRFYRNEASISVPYWHTDVEAERRMAEIRQIAALLESETEFVAFDPQLDHTLFDEEAEGSSINDGARVMDETHAAMARVVGSESKRKRWWKR